MFKQEIERKWIANLGGLKKDLSSYECDRIIQGYLSQEADSLTVRVRSVNSETHYLTIKDSGLKVRNEITYDITKSEFETSLILCGTKIIKKKRYFIPSSFNPNNTIELDVFDDFEFSIAEFEGDSEIEVDSFQEEDWFVKEVTNDFKYHNNYLAYNKKG